MSSEHQGKASKRELMKRPIRWIGERLDEFRSKSASPRPTRPSSPQPTLLPADATPLPQDATRVPDVLAPLSEDRSVLEPLVQETLCSSTNQTLESVSSVPIELRGDRPQDGLEENAQLDALPRVQNRKVFFCFPPDAAETENLR
ncbi:hypothetical protein BKA70DRAFT_1232472 [Coprinopsis sp. MPI-PUGE-AT-0042]|nr:hypothetical protein BKA70DRAFT_1232472 [Coprinopsis sp. MPI-PUGE-AT-0042]